MRKEEGRQQHEEIAGFGLSSPAREATSRVAEGIGKEREDDASTPPAHVKTDGRDACPRLPSYLPLPLPVDTRNSYLADYPLRSSPTASAPPPVRPDAHNLCGLPHPRQLREPPLKKRGSAIRIASRHENTCARP